MLCTLSLENLALPFRQCGNFRFRFRLLFFVIVRAPCVWVCGCTCECVAISKSDSNNNASIMSERENEFEARRERERRAEVRRRQDHANGILVESFAIYFYCSSLIESVEATKSHRRPDKSVRQCKTPLKTHTGHKKYINNSTLKY